MNLLFVCKHNRFRSKVAEVIFKKLNKNKHIKVKSAAKNPDYIPVAEHVQKGLRELGYKKADRHPKKLTKKLINWADLIVVVADDVKLNTKKKKIVWKIPDTTQNDYKGILARTKLIEKRIKKLINMLK